MFGGSTSTEYDDIVGSYFPSRFQTFCGSWFSRSVTVKTTDENLTSENWELILNLCDKVAEEGQPGYIFFTTFVAAVNTDTAASYRAHAVIAAILKRLAHRNPNVQLYALSLSESLSKNLGIEVHREIASRAFTQSLEKLITDRVSILSFGS